MIATIKLLAKRRSKSISVAQQKHKAMTTDKVISEAKNKLKGVKDFVKNLRNTNAKLIKNHKN